MCRSASSTMAASKACSSRRSRNGAPMRGSPPPGRGTSVCLATPSFVDRAWCGVIRTVPCVRVLRHDTRESCRRAALGLCLLLSFFPAGSQQGRAHSLPMGAAAARDEGLRRITGVTRAVVAGAVVVTGGFTALVARTLPGKARGQGVSTANQPADPSTGGDDPELDDPASPPSTNLPSTNLPPATG